MRTFTLHTHLHPELDYHAYCQCGHQDSGNFYDFINLDGSRLAISFGDLPPAGDLPSLSIPCMQALVRGLTAGSRGDLAGLVHDLNDTLYLLGPQDLCVPWFYALIDPVRHELEYVNAGHEAPLLIRRNGGAVRLERTGAALGLSVRDPHRRKTVTVDPGDILAIFSEAVEEGDVLAVVRKNPDAGAAELTRRILQQGHWPLGEDHTFAAVRILDACRHPLLEDSAVEQFAMCAA